MPPDYNKGLSLAYLSIFCLTFGLRPDEEDDLGRVALTVAPLQLFFNVESAELYAAK